MAVWGVCPQCKVHSTQHTARHWLRPGNSSGHRAVAHTHRTHVDSHAIAHNGGVKGEGVVDGGSDSGRGCDWDTLCLCLCVCVCVCVCVKRVKLTLWGRNPAGSARS